MYIHRSRGAYAVLYNHPQALKICIATADCTEALLRIQSNRQETFSLCSRAESPRGTTWQGWTFRL